MTSHIKDLFVPTNGVGWSTDLYDPVRSWLAREHVWKARLVEQVAPEAGERILDLGCGTGALTIMLHQACPDIEVIGLDVDRDALRMARAKARAAGVAVSFWQGPADDPANVPMFRRGSFEKIVSSLLFHRLSAERKRMTFAHAAILLRGGGAMHVADWGKPHSGLMQLMTYPTQMSKGFANTSDNVRGLLPQFMREAGFANVLGTNDIATAFGSLTFYRGTKP